MSRMDRYKHLHDEPDAKEKESIFSRKERKTTGQPKEKQVDNRVDDTDTDQYADYQSSQRATSDQRESSADFLERERNNAPAKKSAFFGFKKKKSPKNKPVKQKRRKKHPILSLLLKLLLLIAAYSVVAFLIGHQVAKNDSSIPNEETETFNGFSGSDGSHNILLLGSDSRDGETARADSVMVLQLDGPAKKPKLISFMRDTLVDIPGYGSTKLNAAYAYGGAELMRQTLAQNFGIDTQYYAKVDFKSFEKVIDTLFPSGVSIDAEKDMSDYIDVAIKKGPQKMDGFTLLQYARFRMDEEGDFGRVRRQQQTMNAIFSQMKNPLSIIKLPYATGKTLGYASTNLPTSFLLRNTFSIAKGAMGVDRLTVPAENSWSYGTTSDGASVLVVDYEMNKAAITEFLAK